MKKTKSIIKPDNFSATFIVRVRDGAKNTTQNHFTTAQIVRDKLLYALQDLWSTEAIAGFSLDDISESKQTHFTELDKF